MRVVIKVVTVAIKSTTGPVSTVVPNSYRVVAVVVAVIPSVTSVIPRVIYVVVD